MNRKGLVAIVTGANSGIGYKIAECLLGMELTVLGLDKNINNIKEINTNLFTLEVDLSKEADITGAFQWVEGRFGRVDVLVNNAGIGGSSTLLDGNTAEWRKLLEVNVLAVAQCTVEAIRIMRKYDIKHGQIINLTSYAANIVPSFGPFHFYSASKFAVRALTEGFRQELKDIDSPIRISSIEPGLVKSDIYKTTFGGRVHEAMYRKYPYIEPSDIASAVEYILNVPPQVNVNNINIKPLGAD